MRRRDERSRDPRPQLVCSIGTANYQTALYRLGDQTWETPYAPVAVARLHGLRGARATVLVTPAARQTHFATLADELRAAGVEPEPVDIPDGRTEAEILGLVDQLIDALSDVQSVVLDTTYALRHLPFVYLATLTYLTAYRDLQIERIYYGAFEFGTPTKGGPKEVPVLDLTTLFTLTEWYHAVRMAREAGDLRPADRLLSRDIKSLFTAPAHGVYQAGARRLSTVRGRLHELAGPLAMGLPLEIGIQARRLALALAALEAVPLGGRLAHRALDLLRDPVESWAIRQDTKHKARIELDEAELRRQLALAEWYAERDELDKALLLLREWLVSLVLWRRGERADWLERRVRVEAERVLNALDRRAAAGLAEGAQAELAGLWASLGDQRNALAHGGMRAGEVKVDRAAVDGLLRRCRELLEAPERLALPEAATGRWLVTPLGLTPGALYSAVAHLRPVGLVVLTSSQARAAIDHALQHARHTPDQVLVYELAEPFTGFGEARQLATDRELLRCLVWAGDVVVNLTGGSTALQYAAERVASAAADLGVPVRRVALVDRRPPQAQREDPYQLGELVCLDDGC